MSVDTAYLSALKMLARRELSEAQLRERLARRGHDQDAIDQAVAQLKSERNIDDARVAAVIARHETSLRGRGRLRVKQRIMAAGISANVAQHAIEEVFRDLDSDALLAAALERKLRGRSHVADDREFQRLYRHLVGQGFEPDRVIALLRKHSPRASD